MENFGTLIGVRFLLIFPPDECFILLKILGLEVRSGFVVDGFFGMYTRASFLKVVLWGFLRFIISIIYGLGVTSIDIFVV